MSQTHTRLTALRPGLTGWAGTREGEPIWILLKQETVSGSGISWAICKSAPRSRQITTPAPHHSVFYRPDALPATQPTASKHWKLYETQWVTLSFAETKVSNFSLRPKVCSETELICKTRSNAKLWSQNKVANQITFTKANVNDVIAYGSKITAMGQITALKVFSFFAAFASEMGLSI